MYQWVLTRVKPERDQNNRSTYRDSWWIFGEARSAFRPALSGLRRFIATVETAKHRFFVFLDACVLADNKLVNIATHDAWVLGVLSSRVHVTWAFAAGSLLEDRPVYVKTTCFEPFPFPVCPDTAEVHIRDLGEKLNCHRRERQDLHPDLTLTDMYNVLEKLRTGEPLAERERRTHELGLVSVLREIQDELDRAVFDAYGWSADLTAEEMLFLLVGLNAERAAEEQRGIVHWLRPEFQRFASGTQTGFEAGEAAQEATEPSRIRRTWPTALAERVRAVREILAEAAGPAPPETLARRFAKARATDVREVLDTLVYLGQAREIAGKYVV